MLIKLDCFNLWLREVIHSRIRNQPSSSIIVCVCVYVWWWAMPLVKHVLSIREEKIPTVGGCGIWHGSPALSFHWALTVCLTISLSPYSNTFSLRLWVYVTDISELCQTFNYPLLISSFDLAKARFNGLKWSCTLKTDYSPTLFGLFLSE